MNLPAQIPNQPGQVQSYMRNYEGISKGIDDVMLEDADEWVDNNKDYTSHGLKS
jgi:hypothetical protein